MTVEEGRFTGFDQELFERFVELSGGSGEPVYWYMKGEVNSYPDGAPVAVIEGVDMRRIVWPEGARNTAEQLSRKIYVYRDPETGELLKEYQGQPVTYIKYPYQYVTFQLAGDKLRVLVEQTKLGQLQKIDTGGRSKVRRFGETIVFSSPLFLDYEMPGGGRYQAYENYDFILHPGAGQSVEKYQLSWNRFADRAPWAGEGRVMMQMVGWRVDRFEELPEGLRTYIEKEAPMWKQPPRDLAEIRELQK